LLAFAGLVAGNTEKGADNTTVAANIDEGVHDNLSDIPDSSNSTETNDFGTNDGEEFFHGHGHDQRGDQEQPSQDSESSQDQYFQAPSGGFEQGAGSSGSSH